jgi:hypothetical protein
VTDAARHPFWLKCVADGHIWIGCYLPMDIRATVKVLRSAHCPMCGAGAKQITFAKQTAGELQEPGGPDARG